MAYRTLVLTLVQNPLEDDVESTFAESVNTSTASISSSILNYRTLHGRRFHSEVGNASYWYTHPLLSRLTY